MRRLRICNFESIEDQFNFGRYNGLSLADVLDINPSYLSWCVKHCTGIIFQLEDKVMEEIKIVYPSFTKDSLFESKRIWNLYRSNFEESYGEDYYNDIDEDNYDEIYEIDSYHQDTPTFDRYADSWAQYVEGYSDDDIDTIFDGDPSAYWNID